MPLLLLLMLLLLLLLLLAALDCPAVAHYCPAALFGAGGKRQMVPPGERGRGRSAMQQPWLSPLPLPACPLSRPSFLPFLPSRQVIDSPEVLSVIDALPHMRPFLSCLYECKYAEFFRVSAARWSPAESAPGGNRPAESAPAGLWVQVCGRQPCQPFSRGG